MRIATIHPKTLLQANRILKMDLLFLVILNKIHLLNLVRYEKINLFINSFIIR
jgi:hypothetical protein